MTADKPRRLPRFSLITLIVAVNVAGVLAWANVTRRDPHAVDIPQIYPQIPRAPGVMPVEAMIFKTAHGWPLIGVLVADDLSWEASYSRCSLNVGIAIAILFCSCVSTEFLVRKLRKAMRHDG